MVMENFNDFLFPPLLKIYIHSFKKSLSVAQCAFSPFIHWRWGGREPVNLLFSVGFSDNKPKSIIKIGKLRQGRKTTLKQEIMFASNTGAKLILQLLGSHD